MSIPRNVNRRRQSAAAALASIRAEGLRPSKSVQLRIQRYVKGEIGASQLRSETLKDIHSRLQKT